MSRALKVVLVVAALAVAAAGGLYLWQQAHPPILPPSPVEAKHAPPVATGPKYPVKEAAEKPLPALGASDPQLIEALAGLLGRKEIERFFNLEDIVRRIVATIDNLPRETYAMRLNPVRPIAGLPRTAGKGEALVLAPENSQRYVPFIQLVEAADTDKTVTAYFHYYALFQQAYRELGYPNGHFNDRLVEVIDHLLATPEVKGPIRLVVPHVLYEYADPDLQSLSSGQKVLIRMGRENAARVQAKLHDVRAQVTAGAPRNP